MIETQQSSTVAQTENRSGAILDPSDTPTETPDNPNQGEGGTTGGEGGAGTDGSQDTPQTSNVRGYSSFLSMVSNNTHGAPAEAAARLAIYGGAVLPAPPPMLSPLVWVWVTLLPSPWPTTAKVLLCG